MAKKSDGRSFNVSVIGLSGTERDKGQYGVGKSCLCNRFIYQVADRYHQEHISVLSQSDFAGRVINNDHFLYWGDVTKTDEGNNFTFQVVEQTEFIDDVSFLPFKTGRTEPYAKRCVAAKVQSAEKLMYICKDQLGMESDYQQKIIPEGKIGIDGFICCFDVSQVQHRPVDKQVEFVTSILSNALKTKKPLVLATTKHDEADECHVERVERMLNKKEFKGSFPLVETSAQENVNVELAFMTLAHMIDKTKTKPKVLQYQEAIKARQEILNVATKAYQNLLKHHVTDPKALWQVYKKKFDSESDFGHYVDLFGTEMAKKLFRQHVKKLRDKQIMDKEHQFVLQIPQILKHFLPNLDAIADRSWPTIQKSIQKHPDFHNFFVEPAMFGQDSWKMCESFLDDPNEKRIPFDLLNTSDAETCFRNHVNELQANHRRKELQQDFRKLLQENNHVTPGKPLNETYVFFVGKESYNALTEADRLMVYEQHQNDLKQRAKHDLQELLWEKSDVFFNLNSTGRMTPEDLKEITNALQDDPRYRILQKLEEDRKVMVLNHLGFIQCPSKDRCYFKYSCVDMLVQQALSQKAARPEKMESRVSTESAEKTLNLVLLGKEGLAIDLNREIRNLCSEDEYRHNNEVYSLDYRPIDGDVSLEQNALATANFKPHGCLCVYNSMHTLDYVRTSLERSLFTDLEQEQQTLHGIPIAIIQAHNAGHCQKEADILHKEGLHLARRLHGEFIHIPEDEQLDERSQFSPKQIHKALSAVISRCSASLGGWLLSQYAEPDIRVKLCMMCGDQYSVDVPLGPLLNHELCQVSPQTHNKLTIDMFLEYTKQRVQIEVLSYHAANVLQDNPTHGYILVYSAKRKASLCTLRAFAMRLPAVPKLLLAIVDSGGSAASFFSNNFSQTMITEGNAIADQLEAHFMTSTANFQQQTAVYVPFFQDAWERKEESEDLFRDTEEEQSPPAYEDPRMSFLDKRPPAPLPPHYSVYQTNKSSTSNSQSTEDSEPLYDQPTLYHSQYSDSDHERASSVSPTEEIYAEVGQPNGEHLVKPSYVKTRRNMYAAQHTKDHRKSLPILESSDSKTMTESTEFSDSDLVLSAAMSKSYSLKLESQSEEEGAWALNDPVKERSYLLASKQTSSSEEGWADNPAYDSFPRPQANVMWSSNDGYNQSLVDTYNQMRIAPTRSQHEAEWSENDCHLAADRRKTMGVRSHSQGTNQIQAPLAIPEPIEIPDYCTVKDAVSRIEAQENDYALVQDALPAGKLCRIKSTARQKEKGSDSEDSEFSSLEREKKHESIYQRVSRRPTPYRKKAKQKTPHEAYPKQKSAHSDKHRPPRVSASADRAQSNSASEECSDGTGEEFLSSRKEKKRRSLKQRNLRSLISNSPQHPISPPVSDSDHYGSPPYRQIVDDDSSYPAMLTSYTTLPRYGVMGGEDFDPNDSGHWRHKLFTLRDPEKQKKKLEKRNRDDERRRLKEEEKRQKEKEKLQKKIKKKDSKSSGPSQSGFFLEDFPTSSDNPFIPSFVEKCITYIEQEGLQAEGIYRIPGNKAQVDLLVSKVNEDPNVDISTLEIQVNAVATVLKGFFMDLTDPLIPQSLYEELIHAAGVPGKSSRLLALRGVFKKLQQQNYEQNFQVLKYLITHLHRVTKHAEVNSMDSQNLARCWWPTVMRLDIKSYEQMGQYSRYAVDIMQTLIEQFSFFFHGGDEV